MVDAGIESASHVASVGQLNRMPSNTGILPSRLGLRGKEDLGAGLSAIYTLEMGFALDTGASGQGGRLLGRQSTVGLSGDWGAVHCERIDEATGWIIGEPGRGLNAMFVMMNAARLHVALQDIGLLDAAWQKADAYSRERRQMRAPGRGKTTRAAGGATITADLID